MMDVSFILVMVIYLIISVRNNSIFLDVFFPFFLVMQKELAVLVKEGEAKKKKKGVTKSCAKDKTVKTPTSATKDHKTKTSDSPGKKSPASPTNDQKPKTTASLKKTPTASLTIDKKPKTSASPKKKIPAAPKKDEKSSSKKD